MLTESEIKQLAEECREIAKTVTVVHAGTNYSSIADALEQMLAERDVLKSGARNAVAAAGISSGI
jgi:dihydrodipicolinate synthase/N-acetylneuraminate lyase